MGETCYDSDAFQQQILPRKSLPTKELMYNDSDPPMVTESSYLALAQSPAVTFVTTAAAAATTTVGMVTQPEMISTVALERKVAPAAGALQRWRSAKAAWSGHGAFARPHINAPLAAVTMRQTSHASAAKTNSHINLKAYADPGMPRSASLALAAAVSKSCFSATPRPDVCRSLPTFSGRLQAADAPFQSGIDIKGHAAAADVVIIVDSVTSGGSNFFAENKS